MKHYLFPDEQITSTYAIDFEGYYKKGYRGLIFDIDNTLVPHGHPADKRAVKLFRRLGELGFQWVFLSNNKELRVKTFQEKVPVFTWSLRQKPQAAGSRSSPTIWYSP